MKTTAPKVYCVRPNAALVAPGESVDVQVILLGLKEEPAADFKCKDKFLVIALPAPYDLGETSVADAWAQLEAEFKDKGLSKKIKVNYMLDAEPRTAQEQEAEQEPEVVGSSTKEDVSTTGVNTKAEESAEAVQKRTEPAVSESPAEETKVEESSKTPIPATAASSSSMIPAVAIWALVGFVIWYWFF